VKNRSPRDDEYGIERPPSYKALNSKKPSDNLVKKIEPVNGRADPKKYMDNMVVKPPEVSKNVYYYGQQPQPQSRQSNSRGGQIYVDPRDQSRPLNSREQNRPTMSREMNRPVPEPVTKQVYANKQEYIINKYQQDANRLNNADKHTALDKYEAKVAEEKKNYQRVYSDNGNVLSRRAEYLLQKYQPANEKTPSHPELKPNVSPTYQNNPKEVDSMINNYQNIYNLKQQYEQVQYGRVQNPLSPYQKPDYNYQGQQKYGVQNKNIFSNENNQVNLNPNQYYQGVNNNHIKGSNNQLQQQRGVTRPVWWG
jgi:hypothetical protein